MLRSLNPLTLAALLVAAFTSITDPAAAQDAGGDKVRMVIIYGDDAAPLPEGDEILVVGVLPEEERYRIPEGLRTSDDPDNIAWARRVERFDFVGDFGILSCSPSGSGGITGCTQELIDAAYDAKRNSADVRFGQLIEAARAERLADIDADAAAEQERVEAIEREYMERLERERAAETGDGSSGELPDPAAQGSADDGVEAAAVPDGNPGQ